MTEDIHLNNQALFTISDEEDQRQSIGGIHDEDYSFNSNKFRAADHWQNLHEFDDSNMIQESSEPIIYQNSFQGNSFLEETKRILGEFQELKEVQKKFSNRHANQSISQCKLEPEQFLPLPKRKTITKKMKVIEKSVKPLRGKKVYRKSNLRNLKNISSEVCDFVHNSETTTYQTLFQKFVGTNLDQNKNLRRRMYDVINVLSSANILQKRGEVLYKQGLAKKNKNSQKVKIEHGEEQSRKIQELKALHAQKLRIIKQKRKIVEQLKQKSENLQKLTKRNQCWGDKVSQNQKIHFPLYFCQAKKDLQIELTENSHQMKFQRSTMHEQNQGNSDFNFIQREVDQLQYLRMRRNKRYYSPLENNQTNCE